VVSPPSPFFQNYRYTGADQQMKTGGPVLRRELDDIGYLDSHPEVCQFFKDAGCYQFCKKLQGFHQQVAEAFALTFDGRKAVIGQDEFQVDEALIAEVTEFPRTGENWFKTTVTKDIEFRSYLKPEHKCLIWKKDIPISFLEKKWQHLLKAILAYITCEGRYHRVMIYHFKLMNHFTGRSPLNLPYYLHKSLSKMAHQVKAKPSKIEGRLSHHGLIKLLVCELLQRRNRDWGHFLFWNEFQTDSQLEDKEKSSSKKSSTPRGGKRKRRAISPVTSEQDTPSSKHKEARKRLEFVGDTEHVVPKETNLLNLPYSDSDEESGQGEIPVAESVEFSMEQAPETKCFTSLEKGESSSRKKKQSKAKEIKKLKRKIEQQEVLERVIKARYETLSKNFAETSAALEKLAHESIKEKKKQKKMVKDYNSLWWLARHLKKKVKLLKLRAMPAISQPQTSVDLQTLANAASHLNDPEAAIPEIEQDAEASEQQPQDV
jgi:hypothetical protein